MNQSIAIIGMAGRFPEAESVDAFYRNLSEGRCSIRSISDTRLTNTTLSKEREYQLRGFIEDIHYFDHKYFGIPMGEAVNMDPHQRMLLEVVHDAIADAGYSPDTLGGTNTAVYVADKNLRYYEHADAYDPTLVTGNASEFMAARINRAFNFNGSTALIDTSCSSSLVALHNACNELALGDADQAIVCGANLELFPYKDIGFHIEVDSADGSSIPFSDRSNGMVYGEAVVVFLLKPLSSALRDKDVVHAVIRSTTVNNNAARSASLTAPDAYGQAEVLLRTWNKAGVKASEIGFIEAHGSGTQLGDSLEVGGLNEAIRRSGEGDRIPISTVKANIGHCRTVAGLAGLMKAVLSVKHGVHFPAVYTGIPSPLIRFEEASVFINESMRPWTESSRPRLAGVSSIGFSGTNCHVLVQQAPDREGTGEESGDQLICLSGRSADGFRANVQALHNHLEANPGLSIHDLGYTLGVGRRAANYRKAIRATRMEDVLHQCAQLLEADAPAPVSDRPAKLFFIFSDGANLTESLIGDYRRQYPVLDGLYSGLLSQCLRWVAQPSSSLHYFVFQIALYRFLEHSGITSQHLLGLGSGRLVTRVIGGQMPLADAVQQFLAGASGPAPDLDRKLSELLERESASQALFMDLSLGCELSARLRPVEATAAVAVMPVSMEAIDFMFEAGRFLFEHNLSIGQEYFGKGQRISLPAPGLEKITCWIRTAPKEMTSATAAPDASQSDELQKAVGTIWSSVLRISATGAGLHFFEAGGDSLGASAVVRKIRETLGVKIEFEDLFDYPVFEDFLQFLRSRMTVSDQLLLIWKEVLRSDDLKTGDNFFELGGHSLLANQILNRVRQRLGLQLDFEDFFKHPTVEAQALLIEQRQTPEAHRQEAIPRLPDAETYPTSHSQRRLWILSNLEKASFAYSEFNIARLTGPVSYDALSQAIDAIVDRHESFRTVFRMEGPELRQVVCPRSAEHGLRYLDLSANADPEAATLELAHELKQTPFDLERGPLFGCTLVRLGGNDFAFLMVIHHIIFDEWSFGVFQKELAQHYVAFAEGRTYEQAPLGIQYRDYAAWVNQRVEPEVQNGIPDFWLQQLDDRPAPCELPLDHPRPAVQRHEGRLFRQVLDGDLRNFFTGTPGVSGFMTAIATVSLLLHKYSAAETVVLGSPVAGRDHWELEDQVGFFVNTVVLRSDINSQETYRELLEQVRQRVIGAFEHQWYPFDLLVERLGAATDRSRHPLFDVMVLYRKVDDSLLEPVRMGAIDLKPFADTTTTSKFDLSIEFIENGSEVSMNITYNSGLFEEDTIRQLAQNYKGLITELLREPGQAIESISLLNAEEQHHMLNRFGKGPDALPHASLVGLFNDVVRQQPDETALHTAGRKLTYAELSARVDAAAAYLQEEGVGRGTPVALLLDRGPSTIVAILAVLRAGGVYVPIGANEVTARVLHVLRSSKAHLVLTSEAILAKHPRLQGDAARVMTSLPENSHTGIVFPTVLPGDTACILYTSGSTGSSKGVVLRHQGLANTVRLLRERNLVDTSPLILHRISYVFDFSILEIFGALCNGAALYVAGEEELDMVRIAKLMRDRGITGACFTPTELRQLLEVVELQTGRLSAKLQWIISGGEELSPDLTALYYRHLTAPLINIYGPTEASIFVASHEVRAGDRRIPVGRAVPGMHLMLLDAQKRPVAAGLPGRLYLGGCGLASGYLPPDDANNDRFERFTTESGEEAIRYDTGDMCRWLPDGTLKFMTRADHQIKINGFRIEPGEVESALLEHDSIEAAAVVCVAGEKDKELVGFVVAKASGGPKPEAAAPRLANEKERQRIAEWNQTENEFIPSSIIASLEYWARVRPEAPAVACGDERLSYAELLQRVEALSAQLRAEGIGKGSIVPVLCPRSNSLLITMLALFRCGAAYLPLSPEWPASRIEEIINDCAAEWVIDGTESVTASGSARILVLPELLARPETETFPASEPGFNDPAYIIYTSGSTGRPKGVVIHNGGMMNHLQSKIESLELGTESRIIQNAPQVFDISIWQFLTALLCGGTTLVYPDALVRNLQAFTRQVATDEADILELVPSYLSEIVDQPGVENWRLRLLVVTGETLKSRLAQRWLERRPDVLLVNAYGPTEASDDIAHYYLRAGDAIPGTVPVGRAVRNMRLYVLNEALEHCGIGERGEIFTAGAGVGLGYLNDKAKTLAAFTADPFMPGQRMYRTGDIGRFLDDGNLEFLGRADAQVKVRGNRIELGEVEHRLMTISQVKDAVVLCRNDDNGQAALVAYVKMKPGTDAGDLRREAEKVLPAYMVPSFFQPVDTFPLTGNGKVNRSALANPFVSAVSLQKALRGHLAQRLPDYMIPSRVMVLEKLPLTATGKTDRVRLIALAREAAVTHAYIVPETETQRTLCSIWSQVLNRDRVGIRDDFFAIGGNSLKGMRLIAEIERTFGQTIDFYEIFIHVTVEQQASLLSDIRPDLPAPVVAHPQRSRFPATHAQRRLFILGQLEPTASAYHITGGISISGQLDADLWRKAWAALIGRHAVLRTVFEMEGEEPIQVILPAEEFSRDLVVRSASGREAVTAIWNEQHSAPFQLHGGHLVRATLVCLENNEFIFLYTLHHTLVDEWSFGVLGSELLRLYETGTTGAPANLPALEIHYGDFALWQQEQLKGSAYGKSRLHWQKRFAGLPQPIDLPYDRPRPAVKTYAGDQRRVVVKGILKGLRRMSEKEGTSLFMNLHAALQVLLFQYTGQTDLVVGTPIAGRETEQLKGQVGLYQNTLALRTQIDPESDFTTLLRTVRANLVEDFAHQHYPFDLVVEEANAPRDLSRSPLFDVMIVLHDAELSLPQHSAAAIQWSEYSQPVSGSKFDLSFHFLEKGDDLLASINYNTDLFDKEHIDLLLEHLLTLLNSLVAAPQLPVRMATCISPGEEARLKTSFANLVPPLPFDTIEGWLQSAAIGETEEAVVCGTVRLDRKELMDRSGRLANRLRQEFGIGRGSTVAVLLPPSAELVIALLAIVRAGAAYLPLDRQFPDARLRHMIGDSGVQVGITDQDNDLFTACLVWNASFDKACEAYPAGLQETALPGDIAYVIYTSGSTGLPKGVPITQASLCHYVHGFATAHLSTGGQRGLLVSSIAFDLGYTSFWTLLLGFGTICLGHETAGFWDAASIWQTIAREKISMIKLTPSHLKLLLDARPVEPPAHLSLIVTGGEAIDTEAISCWMDWNPNVRFVNHYGPTETTVGVLTQGIVRQNATAPDFDLDTFRKRPVLGRPLGSHVIRILDTALRLQPVGVMGEICIGGPGLSEGYLNLPELTAEKFIEDPLSPGTRLYRSGDKGRWTAGGRIEFAGRIDQQIKLAGYRIEPGEILAALRRLPGVLDAAVDVRTPGASRQLVAYLVEDEYQEEPIRRQQLSGALAAYMIPSRFVPINAIPLTPNGKVDTSRLPDPETAAGLPGKQAESIEETLILEACRRVMGRKELTLADDFFHLGGDSIRALQIVSHLYRNGYQLQVKDLFTYPVLESLALRLKPLAPVIDQGAVSGWMPFLPIQHDFFDRNLKVPSHYNQSVVIGSAGRFDPVIAAQAVALLQSHHDALRLVFPEGGNGRQFINEQIFVSQLEIVDLVTDPDRFQEEIQLLQRSFNLETGPLFKAVLYRLPGIDQLLLTAHHLVVDGVSWRILLEDFESAYHAISRGEHVALPAKSASVKAWAEALEAYAGSWSFVRDHGYWLEPGRLDIPALAPDAPEGAEGRGRFQFELDEETTTLLLTVANTAFHTETNDLIVAALAQAIGSTWGAENLGMMFEGHGREEIIPDLPVHRSVGWFTSLYPVVLPARSGDWAAQVKLTKEGLRRIPFKGIGYGLLRYRGDVAMDPLPTGGMVLYNYLGQFDAGPANSRFNVSLDAGDVSDPGEPSRFGLTVTGMVAGGKLGLHIEYDRSRFADESVGSLQIAFRSTLQEIIRFCSNRNDSEMTPADLSYRNLSLHDLENIFD